MKTTILYDSTFGNTKIIAEAMAGELGKDAKIVLVNQFKSKDLDGIDLLIVGSPIIAWKPSGNMGKFLTTLKPGSMKGLKAAAFDTRVKLFIHGDAVKKISEALTNANAEMTGELGMFYVKGKEGPLYEGEVEKAKEWARKLKI